MLLTLVGSKWEIQEATLTLLDRYRWMIDKEVTLDQLKRVKHKIKWDTLTQPDGVTVQEITNRGKSQWSLHK